jgi:phosphopantetheinyl transferase
MTATQDMDSGFASALVSREKDLFWSGIEGVRSACLEMVLLDIGALPPAGDDFFTPREAVKASRMGPRRLRTFTAARAALKMLARSLGLAEESRPDRAIETLGPDGRMPWLGEKGLYCSAAHSDRYVAAVAHRHPLGVDIELTSDKVVRTRHLFMNPAELKLFSLSRLGPARAAVRAWTIKEAAAKALKLHLVDAFRNVEITLLGESEGVIAYRGKTLRVKHAEGNGQVLTLITAGAL